MPSTKSLLQAAARAASRVTCFAAGAFLFAGMLVLCGVPAGASAQAAATKAPKLVAPGAPVTYYEGERQVDLVLALDEVAVEAPDGVDVATNATRATAAKVQRVEKLAGRGTHRVRFQQQPDRSTLEARAGEIAATVPGAKVGAVLYAPGAYKRAPEQARILTNRLAVKVRPGVDIADLARANNLTIVEKVSYSPDTYILEARAPGLFAALDAANTIHGWGVADFSTPLIRKQQQRRLIPNDPLFGRQWHLLNTGTNTGVSGLVAGNDVNVTSVWDNYQGDGINIGIVDDGLQVAHPDLAPNARTDIDIDINYGDDDPSPDLTADDHGTACAGVAAARGNNALGVSGAAPHAWLVGVRLISAMATDAQEAQALNHQLTSATASDRISIYSNSWGPNDDGATLEGPGPLAAAALQNGVTNGRGGRGAVYTWACGNGGTNDNANYDGYANSRHTIAVAASGGAGEQSYYSEFGSCVVINAPSSYTGGGITTTDRTGSAGYEDPAGDYTYTFGGTSSASPLAAGCLALLLQAYPNLTWRDVIDVLIHSATKNSPTDSSWLTNGAGLKFSHKFGFGRMNAANALAVAASHSPLPPEATPLTGGETLSSAVSIPDNNATGITRTTTITAPANFKVEYVTVDVVITHTYRGDLEMFLTSPSGTTSQIATVRAADSGDNYNHWVFSSVAHWGENPNGTWSYKVADRYAGDTGSLSSWALTVYGHIDDPSAVGDWMLY
jgi:subtilisin-like proprotein convertase family protein